MRTVGLTMRVTEANEYQECGDTVACDWADLFANTETQLVYLPNNWDIAKIILDAEPFSCIVLSGGNSLSPSLGGLDESAASHKRDRFETTLLDYAIKKKIPVVGVCRGLQVINAHFRGTIEKIDSKAHAAVNHEITFLDQYQELFDGLHIVNSYHDHGLKLSNLSKELDAFAVSHDDVVEGVFHKSLPVMGIMWHPERTGGHGKEFIRLLNELVEKKIFWRKSESY